MLQDDFAAFGNVYGQAQSWTGQFAVASEGADNVRGKSGPATFGQEPDTRSPFALRETT